MPSNVVVRGLIGDGGVLRTPRHSVPRWQSELVQPICGHLRFANVHRNYFRLETRPARSPRGINCSCVQQNGDATSCTHPTPSDTCESSSISSSHAMHDGTCTDHQPRPNGVGITAVSSTPGPSSSSMPGCLNEHAAASSLTFQCFVANARSLSNEWGRRPAARSGHPALASAAAAKNSSSSSTLLLAQCWRVLLGGAVVMAASLSGRTPPARADVLPEAASVVLERTTDAAAADDSGAALNL